MTRNLSKTGTAVVVLLLFGSLIAQESVRPDDIVAEGVIVAFQKGSRYPVRPFTSGTATFVEFWIVRVDKWTKGPEAFADKKYILVEYRLYERGLTDCEINAKKLRFTLRQQRDDKHTNCTVSVEANKNSTGRPPSDYEVTTPGKLDRIPSLSSLPCLIADSAPVVIE